MLTSDQSQKQHSTNHSIQITVIKTPFNPKKTTHAEEETLSNI